MYSFRVPCTGTPWTWNIKRPLPNWWQQKHFSYNSPRGQSLLANANPVIPQIVAQFYTLARFKYPASWTFSVAASRMPLSNWAIISNWLEMSENLGTWKRQPILNGATKKSPNEKSPKLLTLALTKPPLCPELCSLWPDACGGLSGPLFWRLLGLFLWRLLKTAPEHQKLRQNFAIAISG